MAIEFTPEEKRTILLTAVGEQPTHVAAYYTTLLLPVLAVGVWGMIDSVPEATNIAFLSAFLLHLYLIWSSFRGVSTWKSISRKLADSWTHPPDETAGLSHSP